MKTATSNKVIQINNLPNALIASFLNITVNDVVAEKQSIAINAMERLNARLDSYLK